ncbi:MAG: DUF883 family protein [Planctomycetia bacterium]|nr:DUF883 family protein [Planctomycetia bacterium]
MNTSQRTDFRDKGEQAGSNAGRKVGETLEKARDTASNLAEKAGEKVEGAYQKAQEMASNVGQSVRETASQVGDRVRETASHVGEHAHQAYDVAAEKMGEFNDDMLRLIHRHPRQAVLIGFGAGCLIGAVLLGGLFAGSRRA